MKGYPRLFPNEFPNRFQSGFPNGFKNGLPKIFLDEKKSGQNIFEKEEENF